MAKVNWNCIKSDRSPRGQAYLMSGEYQALEWLLAYSEGRASCEPIDLVKATIREIAAGTGDPRTLADYAATILRYA